MELSGVSVKFGYATGRDLTQPTSLDMSFDLGENQPIYELHVSLEIDKSPDAPLSGLKEQVKGDALKLLEEAVRLLSQHSIAELDQQVEDWRDRQAEAWESDLKASILPE